MLLKPGEPVSASVSFPSVLGELDEIRKRCEELRPGCTEGPWNSIELVVRMPENTEVILTAAQPLDPDGPVADRLRAVGFDIPQP